ncbi:hypothetical protein JOD54_004424 [Actinokineospora baliensis]|uniref:excalibur calcium-binding domain-containing protein n=1 Tax=Actinokineospora baliensis TaxID=547056 RepID=UPI001958AA70|nr:excalibur calcium-binding domain-containing protein [Actinokineospora baliensis]MBM7774220.1 hypothetical protein [Actinokineospora baliensis]
MDAVAWSLGRKRTWPRIVGPSLVGLVVIAGIAGCQDRSQGQAAAALPSVAAPPSAAAPEVVAVPTDLVGKSAAEAKKSLQEIGFTTVDYQTVDGRAVAGAENWTVVAVDAAASAIALTDRIVLRVDKPQPAAPAPPVTVAPEPLPAEPEPADVYYKNCAAAKAAGAAPMRVGEPGYRPGLDRDKDGTACDN